MCLWVCYHDNSKLCASILTKLGVYVNVLTISSWLNFGRPAPGEGSLWPGEIFGSALLQPARSVCVSLGAFSFYDAAISYDSAVTVSDCFN